MNQLDSGVFGFDKCRGASLFDDPTDGGGIAPSDPYQAYVITPVVKDRFRYIREILVYKPASISAGCIAKCKMLLNSFFSSCSDLSDMNACEVYLLRKRQGVSPLSQPLPTWTCLDLLTPNPGV